MVTHVFDFVLSNSPLMQQLRFVILQAVIFLSQLLHLHFSVPQSVHSSLNMALRFGGEKMALDELVEKLFVPNRRWRNQVSDGEVVRAVDAVHEVLHCFCQQTLLQHHSMDFRMLHGLVCWQLKVIAYMYDC
jgi:hypothetical protein